jgi:cytidine deaminase
LYDFFLLRAVEGPVHARHRDLRRHDRRGLRGDPGRRHPGLRARRAYRREARPARAPREVTVDWTELDNPDRHLVEQAQEASARAYAPYSLFAVGAAVRAKSGRIYTAANLENASSGLTICAEASALTSANAAGDFDVEAIAVVGLNFKDPTGALRIVMPCGSCRQLIAEAAQLAKSDVRVLCCNGELSSIVLSTISELLPEAFGPQNLGLAQEWPRQRQELHARVKRLIKHRKKR